MTLDYTTPFYGSPEVWVGIFSSGDRFSNSDLNYDLWSGHLARIILHLWNQDEKKNHVRKRVKVLFSSNHFYMWNQVKKLFLCETELENNPFVIQVDLFSFFPLEQKIHK